MVIETCITIDVEFSVGGAFTYPDTHRPIGEENVICRGSGQENGLGFLLDVFRDHEIAATFFVESLQSAYFGDAPMSRVVERILRAGQDVQLHIHPVWRNFRDPDWQARLSKARPNDSCDGRSLSEMQDIVGDGMACLRRAGSPEPIAMRTGNLRADRTVYLAMAACGLKVASNLGVGWWRPRDSDLHLWGGRAWVGGVLEVPVLTYSEIRRARKGRPRLLTTTGSSATETECLLWQARRAAVPTVVLLTHPFEFIKGDRLQPGGQRANRINKRRMERLCAFIAQNPKDFTSVSFAQAAPAWLELPDVPAPALTAPLIPVFSRMIQNGANEFIRGL